MLGRVVVVISG